MVLKDEEKFNQILHLKSDTNQQKNPKPTTSSSEFQIIEEDWKIPPNAKQKKTEEVDSYNEQEGKETAFHRIMSKIREEDDEDTQIEEDSLFGQQSSSKESHDSLYDNFLELDEETEISETKKTDTETGSQYNGEVYAPMNMETK